VSGTRPLVLGAAALAALCLGGCGGDAKRATPPPTLPSALAGSLAARSDSVADALEGGDSCRALTLAQQLQSDTIAAINARRVAPRLQEELTSAVNDLASRVTCTPPAAPARNTGEDKHDRDKHKGKDKGHGKRKHEGDD
jgi:hypothetical protein